MWQQSEARMDILNKEQVEIFTLVYDAIFTLTFVKKYRVTKETVLSILTYSLFVWTMQTSLPNDYSSLTFFDWFRIITKFLIRAFFLLLHLNSLVTIIFINSSMGTNSEEQKYVDRYYRFFVLGILNDIEKLWTKFNGILCLFIR